MIINREDAFVVVVDIQERLFPHIDQNSELLKNLQIFLQGAKILEIPMLVNEQYKKGLGETTPEVKAILGEVDSIEKVEFSCCRADGFMEKANALGKKVAILVGIETHICVLQTALELKASGFTPVVLLDCVGSRSAANKEIATQRLIQEGVLVSSAESILFEMVKSAKDTNFKEISKLVK